MDFQKKIFPVVKVERDQVKRFATRVVRRRYKLQQPTFDKKKKTLHNFV